MTKIIFTFFLIFAYSFSNASGHYNFCENQKKRIESLMISIEDSRWYIKNSSDYIKEGDNRTEEEFIKSYSERLLRSEEKLLVSSQIYKNLCN